MGSWVLLVFLLCFTLVLLGYYLGFIWVFTWAMVADIYAPKFYKFIGCGDIYGPKPYTFIGLTWVVLGLFAFVLRAARPRRDARRDMTNPCHPRGLAKDRMLL